MMALDALLYVLLHLYLEHAYPTRYGTAAHPCFCLQRSWWRSAPTPRDTAAAAELATAGAFAAPAPTPLAQQPTGPAFEPLAGGGARDGRHSIEIVGLSKTYGRGRLAKTAVRELHLSLASGQITCLLGHNGAGKTTTIGVLTGLFPPSAGDCYVLGHSIARAASAVYRLLGICPQHDVLWANLSASEHLQLYAALKRVPAAEVGGAVAETLAEVGLTAKADALSRALPIWGCLRRRRSSNSSTSLTKSRSL